MNKKNRHSNRVYINRNIRAPQVRCIDHNNDNIGVVSISEALSLAQKAELDLVQITPAKNGNVPICKILDYGKYKYELSKRQKDQNRKQRESAVKTKEVKLRPTTDINDLKTKVRHANKFINDGCRVKVVVTFKGREMAHKDIGRKKLDLFLDLVEPEFKVINEPSMDGKHMSTLIVSSVSKEVKTKQALQAQAS